MKRPEWAGPRKWDRLDPAEDCSSPDGHDLVDIVTFGTERWGAPVRILCTRCGRAGSVVVWAEP